MPAWCGAAVGVDVIRPGRHHGWVLAVPRFAARCSAALNVPWEDDPTVADPGAPGPSGSQRLRRQASASPGLPIRAFERLHALAESQSEMLYGRGRR